jgi:hypothetical protein
MAMQKAYTALESLDSDGRANAVSWLASVLGVQKGYATTASAGTAGMATAGVPSARQFHDGETTLSPREFVSSKRPNSHAERVACLAYYLTHHRDLPHFKTADIVQLNTEAAAHKFANPSRDMDNADRHSGYIVSAGGGAKQITVRGEAMVSALPDRDAVGLALREHPFRPKRARESSAKKAASNDGGGQ